MEVITMAKKKAAWTVMVYLAGDNNLSEECLFALTEMKKAAPGERIKVIAQFDPKDEHLPTHRYEINRKGANDTLFDDIIDEARYDSVTREVHFKKESRNANSLAASRAAYRQGMETILADVPDLIGPPPEDDEITNDTDTGSPITLYNFLSFGIQEYPADHYMVVLSGHAGGTERDYLMKDESSRGSLTFNELKQVFKQLKADRSQPIDILGMDNCLMSMGEICYELRDLAQIVVGCESYSPASGWPYRQILERMRKDFAKPKLAKRKSVSAEAAKAIVEEYVNYYSSYWIGGLSVAQSALDLSRIKKLRTVVDKLANNLERELLREFEKNGQRHQTRHKAHPFQDALVLAHWEAQSYNGESFVDLYDFCDCLENRLRSGSVAKSCREVKKFIKSEFVLKSCYSGAVYQYSHGVSMYFPWANVMGSYENLDFIQDSAGSGWGSFLHTYTVITRREPRGIDFKSKLSEASTAAMSLGRMGSDRMGSDRMSSDRMGSDRMGSDRMGSDRMGSDRMGSDRMGSDRMGSDRMGSDRMGSDRMGSDRAGNPIHSMRNPPIIFFPNECIRERRGVLVGQERFFARDRSKER
jgi:pentapeptide MXKDX repeat protein